MQDSNPIYSTDSNADALIESFHRLKSQQLQLDISHYEADELEQMEQLNYYQLQMTRSRLLMMGINPDELSDIPHD